MKTMTRILVVLATLLSIVNLVICIVSKEDLIGWVTATLGWLDVCIYEFGRK